MRAALRAAALAVVACVLAACGGGGGYAAKVDGRVITAADVEGDLRDLEANEAFLAGRPPLRRPDADGAGRWDPAVVAQLLDQRITASLVRAEVRRRDVRVGDADRDIAARQLEAQLVDPATGASYFPGFPRRFRDAQAAIRAESDALQAHEGGVAVDDAAMRTAYRADPGRWAERCARHVLLAPGDEDRAADVHRRLGAGEDFAAVARTSSRDQSTAGRGGELGCLTGAGLDRLSEPVRAAVLALGPGELSAPVTSAHGIHVVRVDEVRARSFEEAAPDVRAALLAPVQPAYEALLRRLRLEAKVQVAARYGRWDRAGPDTVRLRPAEVPR